ncbi:MAG: type II toxin-antitoxin system Phd/YefM family antitoxin [Burkholderiales bacterium]|nr:type II toxin-antitoxin system Phd/YefM family antitoxin [Phycisphaerae bacterium]
MIPLNVTRDIRSLTEFKRNTNELGEELATTGGPMVLTVNGKAKFVIQDAESYQKLLDELDLAQSVVSIRDSLADIDAGHVKPARQMLEQMRKKFKIPVRARK